MGCDGRCAGPSEVRNADLPSLRSFDKAGCGVGNGQCGGLQCPGWWRAVPEEERAVLRSLVRMLQSAKRSRVAGVARAARKWELGLGCFVKVRLLNSCPGRRGQKG